MEILRKLAQLAGPTARQLSTATGRFLTGRLIIGPMRSPRI